jgi:hypothetical protein
MAGPKFYPTSSPVGKRNNNYAGQDHNAAYFLVIIREQLHRTYSQHHRLYHCDEVRLSLHPTRASTQGYVKSVADAPEQTPTRYQQQAEQPTERIEFWTRALWPLRPQENASRSIDRSSGQAFVGQKYDVELPHRHDCQSRYARPRLSYS